MGRLGLHTRKSDFTFTLGGLIEMGGGRGGGQATAWRQRWLGAPRYWLIQWRPLPPSPVPLEEGTKSLGPHGGVEYPTTTWCARGLWFPDFRTSDRQVITHLSLLHTYRYSVLAGCRHSCVPFRCLVAPAVTTTLLPVCALLHCVCVGPCRPLAPQEDSQGPSVPWSREGGKGHRASDLAW